MQMPKQNYQELPFALRRYGCRFMCLAGIAMHDLGKTLTYPEITALYEDACLVPGVITNPDTALCGGKENWIIDEAFRRLGNETRRGIQIGQFDPEGVPRLWNGAPADNYDYRILHWETKGPDGHFTLADKEEEIYDPHDNDLSTYQISKIRIQRTLLYRVWG